MIPRDDKTVVGVRVDDCYPAWQEHLADVLAKWAREVERAARAEYRRRHRHPYPKKHRKDVTA